MKRLVLLFFILLSSLFSANLEFVYKEADSKADKENLSLIKNSKRVNDLEIVLNDIFILKDDIRVIFGTQDSPYFDPHKNSIEIPYSFLQETKDKFKKVNYQKDNIDLDTASIDVLIHTILHELGHALIAMYDIPILGREEDAVDNLGNIILIDYFKDGDDILLTNADIYDVYANETKVLEEQVFMGEHSLDLQRFYSMLCFVYASNPEKYERMLNQYEVPDYRKDICIEDVNIISSSWYRVLKNYIRD